MALSKFMLAAIKALASAEPDIATEYEKDRKVMNLLTPPIKSAYDMVDFDLPVKSGRNVPVRVYYPEKRTSDEVILFFHGGGWVEGNIDNYIKTCDALSNGTGRRVVSVEYRLAPENPFPCGFDDCYEVAFEIIAGGALVDGKEASVILCGDSAGGNLAAAVSLKARDTGDFSVKKQILVYPALSNNYTESSPYDSTREFSDSFLLTTKRLYDFVNHYIQNPDDMNNPYFAPLISDDLSSQPDTLIIAAQCDVLRDEGIAYGRRLHDFGNNVRIYCVKDALHGFFSLPKRVPQVQRAYKYINAFLNGEPAKATKETESTDNTENTKEGKADECKE